jgi:hypothetical protein
MGWTEFGSKKNPTLRSLEMATDIYNNYYYGYEGEVEEIF